MRIPKTTLEQWRVLQALVEYGGFAQAAERLNRSQSAVSYAVARLQERAGIDLLVIDGRKAQLTDAGRSLLAEAVPLVDELLRIEQRAQALTETQANVRLHVDSIYPRTKLFAALRAFSAAYPQVEIDLREATQLAAYTEPGFDLAIVAWTPVRADQHHLLDVDMLALACPAHALNGRSGRTLSASTLAGHRCVSIIGEGASANAATLAPTNGRVWQVNTLEAAVEAVASGLCWGWLPAHLAAPYLDDERLVPLAWSGPIRRPIPLALCYADEAEAGTATRALAQLLRDA